jgi:hypothetical protein
MITRAYKTLLNLCNKIWVFITIKIDVVIKIFVISMFVICSEYMLPIDVECEDLERDQSSLEVIKSHLYKYRKIYIPIGLFLVLVGIGYIRDGFNGPDLTPVDKDLEYLDKLIQRTMKNETNVSPYQTK